MKKILNSLVIATLLVLTMTGCTVKKSFTYSVETGDKIKVELKTNDGYNLDSTLPFTITKDGETLSQGTFTTIDMYNQYVSSIDSNSLATLLDQGSKNGVEYIFYEYNDSEFNYIIKINNSNTAVILGNPISKESAEECFNRLTFSKE